MLVNKWMQIKGFKKVCVLTHCISSLAGSHTEQREGGVGALGRGGGRGQSCAVHLGIRLTHTHTNTYVRYTKHWQLCNPA